MKNISIKAIGAVTPCGDFKNLIDTFKIGKDIENGDIDISPIEEYFPKKQTRRMCRLTSMGLLSVCRCLNDKTFTDTPLSPSTGILFATGYGSAANTFKYLDSIIDYGMEMPSPLSFSTSVQNIPVANIAIALGLKCPVQTLCQLEASVFSALKMAELWLKSGMVDDILLIGADEITEPLKVCSEIISKSYSNHSRKENIISEGAFCIRLCLDNSAENYGHIISLKSNPDKASKGFHSGAYNGTFSTMKNNAKIYGNIPIAMGFDILIGLSLLGVETETIECLSSDRFKNTWSVTLGK